MSNLKIFAATWSSCVYESGFEIISLHKTKKGAEEAMLKHKQKESHPENKAWRVEEYEVEK
jgi:hypothetical protein